jgi:AcrR family transcriptional regulator
MAREERKERITRQREEQILNAALDVFSKKGFGAATIPEIAGEAGLSVGSIYNYFANKRELFVAVIKYFILNAPLMSLIDELHHGDIPGTLRRILENRLLLMENEQVSRIPFLMAEIQRDPELKEIWHRDFLQPFLSKLEGTYRELADTGEYNTVFPVLTVRMVGGLILGFLILRIMEGEKSPVNKLTLDEVTNALEGFVLYGLFGKRGAENTLRRGE